MSVAMFRAPAGFTPKSTSGFVTILEARKKGIGAVLAESNARREHPGLAQHALWATADLMEKADAAERDEMREAVVLSVLETMRAHRNHSLVQFNGVKALTAATAAEGHNELVAREGAVRLLRRHARLPRAFSAQRFADLLGFSLPLTR